MEYSIYESMEAVNDVTHLAEYMLNELYNPKAAERFIGEYDRQVNHLKLFPLGYRGVSFEYRGFEIRIKAFSTYNIFFVVDQVMNRVLILRVLKDRQDWKTILRKQGIYHF